MMATPRRQPPGAPLGYWIVSSRRLGGIAFCAAGWQARDEFAGWSADARVANLQLNNNRILPGVRVCGLYLHASRCPGPSRSGRATAGLRYQALRNNDMLKDLTMGG